MALKPTITVTDKQVKVITGKVRLSYCHLWEPRANAEDPSAKPKYSCMILVPKSDTETVETIQQAIEAAKKLGKDKVWGGKIPAGLKVTFRDADDPEEEEDFLEKNPDAAGHYFMSLSTTTRPGIVDASASPVLDQSEVYSGCYARVSMNVAGYSARGNKGVTAYLNNVQKLADGEALGGGGVRAEDEFSSVEGELDALL